MDKKNIIWINEKLDDIKMGSEGMYGKYPSIILQFEGTRITFPINEERFGKLQRFFKLAEVNGNRGYEPVLNIYFGFLKYLWKDKNE